MSQPKTLTFNTAHEYNSMDFTEVQEFVGGYFEMYQHIRINSTLMFVFNELKGDLPLNKEVYNTYGIHLYGNVIVYPYDD